MARTLSSRRAARALHLLLSTLLQGSFGSTQWVEVVLESAALPTTCLSIACVIDWAEEQCQAAPQGFGNVGGWAAELLEIYGGRIVAVSDRTGVSHLQAFLRYRWKDCARSGGVEHHHHVAGAVFNQKGLDILALKRHLRAASPFGGHLTSFPGGAPCVACSTEMQLAAFYPCQHNRLARNAIR